MFVLLAECSTTPNIARRPVVTEHRVHPHVTNILTKLGVSSRTAAVASATGPSLV